MKHGTKITDWFSESVYAVALQIHFTRTDARRWMLYQRLDIDSFDRRLHELWQGAIGALVPVAQVDRDHVQSPGKPGLWYYWQTTGPISTCVSWLAEKSNSALHSPSPVIIETVFWAERPSRNERPS